MSRRSNGTAANNLGNQSLAVLSGSGGPFTVALWVRADGGTGQSNTYLVQSLDLSSSNFQWAVIFGFVAGKVEFYANGYSGADPRVGSGMTLPDAGWHHVAYRYDGAAWDGFLDGVKTSISGARTFALPGSQVHWNALAAGAFAAGPSSPFNGSLAEIVVDTAIWTDGQIARLARGDPAWQVATVPPAHLWELRGGTGGATDRAHPGTLGALLVGGTVPAGVPAPVRYPPRRMSPAILSGAQPVLTPYGRWSALRPVQLPAIDLLAGGYLE